MSKYEKETPADPDFQLKVEIDDAVYQKVMHWVNKSDYEVSGLGKVIYDAERKVLRVVSAILLDQENTRGTTEIDGAAIGKAMYEMRDDVDGTLNWWWHSHVKMGVFWSGTDHTAIKTLGQGGYFLSTVFNQRNEMLSCYYQSQPIQVFADRLDTKIVRQFDTELLKAWDTEYAEKVKNKTYGTYSGPGNSGNGSYGNWGSHGGRWGGTEGHGSGQHGRRELPRSGVTHTPSSTRQAGFGHYGMDFDDDDDYGVPGYTSPSARGEHQAPPQEDLVDDLKEELEEWDLELNDLIEQNKFPSFPKKTRKRKGA